MNARAQTSLKSACAQAPVGILQRRAASDAKPGSVPPIVHEALRSPGQPLDVATRAVMEPRFGHDFGKVRVHADGKAAESARAVSARAYTLGRDIVFGAGEYSPSTPAGRKLIAHELAHVVQQDFRDAGSQTATDVGSSENGFEKAAEQAAAKMDSPAPRPGQSRAPAVKDPAPVLRRTPTVGADTAEFKVSKVPEVEMQFVPNVVAAAHLSAPIEFTASAKVECGSGESASGYELGIVQVETSEVNHALYQGATAADGVIHVYRDAPPMRPAGTCIDSLPGKFWIASAPAACGGVVPLTREDRPIGATYPPAMQNSVTGKRNELKSLNVELHFTTALMLKKPDGSLQALRWIAWSLYWDYASGEPPRAFGIVPVSSASGSPPPELPAHYAVPAITCNDLADNAKGNPKSIVTYGGSVK